MPISPFSRVASALQPVGQNYKKSAVRSKIKHRAHDQYIENARILTAFQFLIP